MIISCTNCTTRLQLEDAKVPSRPFTVRCPKCQQIINAQPGGVSADGSAIAAGGDLPATTRTQRDAKTAPAQVLDLAVEGAEGRASTSSASPDAAELVRLLAELVGRGVAAEEKSGGAKQRPVWDKRRALVCVSTSHRSDIAQKLAADGYEAHVAEDTARAMGRMREDKVDVIILDPEFDMAEQGAAFIMREVNALRPSERRRLIVVHLSPSVRTEDAHAAFLSNVDLIVNAGEVGELPRALERTVRDHGELYKDLNKALGVGAL